MNFRITAIDGVELEYTPDVETETKVDHIEMWYDRHRREWVIYPVDENGYQAGDYRYGFSKVEAKQIKADLEAELM